MYEQDFVASQLVCLNFFVEKKKTQTHKQLLQAKSFYTVCLKKCLERIINLENTSLHKVRVNVSNGWRWLGAQMVF